MHDRRPYPAGDTVSGCLVALRAVAAIALIAFMPVCFGQAQTRIGPRVAVLPMVGDDHGLTVAGLRKLLAADTTLKAELLDQDLTLAAAAGSGLMGNLNLSLSQARGLGVSLGADFYLLGKFVSSRRAAEGEKYYFESMAGIFLVESRSGRLLLFRLVRAQAPAEQEAVSLLLEKLALAWPEFSEAMRRETERRTTALDDIPRPAPEVELTDAEVTGGSLPVFFQRLKPDYTAGADLNGITGTVELEAVFRDDGTIDDIRVVRWAGFGLDESAISTLKRLRFKPAERDGKMLTIRGLVRYNFIRPRSQETGSPSLKSEEAERLRRSLQRILTPGGIPDKPTRF